MLMPLVILMCLLARLLGCLGGDRGGDYLLTYLCPSLTVEHRPSTTPRHRTLFWAALVIPDQLVPWGGGGGGGGFVDNVSPYT